MAVEDSRVSNSKAKILKTTWDLLAESGLSGVSIDEVSRSSGIAKTTIYRHWKTKTDLLIAACSQPQVELAVPESGTVRGDLMILVGGLAKMLKTARWATVLPSVVDGAERDDAIAKLHGELQRAHSRPFRKVIQRAIENGQLPKKTDVGLIVSLLMGPLFYRRWFSRERLDSKFVRAIVEKAIS